MLVKARSGRNTRTSVFLGVPYNHRPTETRFRWAIVDGERLFIAQKLFGKSVPYVGLLWFKSMIFNIIYVYSIQKATGFSRLVML